MINQIKHLFYFLVLISSLLLTGLFPSRVLALTPGALVYRTTSDGKMFGYSSDELLEIENGILKNINPGHVGIYVGQGADGEHYIVEALAGGIVKTPAKYFVNEALGEKLLGAKMPRFASSFDRLKAVKIAESLVGQKLGYDFDFKNQKGPGSGDWTCVGLVEKVYESAGISNPNNPGALEYDPNYYRINITPDGFDKESVINQAGDCFSQKVEFSKIARRANLFLPLPELIGFNAGLEYRGDRYIFLPYTQFIQPTLVSEKIDIELIANFKDELIRGKTPVVSLLLRWSLINNPLSSVKVVVNKTTEVVENLWAKIFGQETGTKIVLSSDSKSSPQSSLSSQEGKVVINQSAGSSKSSGSKALNDKTNQQNKAVATSGSGIVINSNNSPIKNSTGTNNLTNENENKIKVLGIDSANNKSETTNNNLVKTNKVINTATSSTVSSLNTNNISTANTLVGSTNNVNSINNISSTAGVSVSKISAGLKTISNTTTNTATNTATNASASNPDNNSAPVNSQAPQALINKIYATGNNDFIELYNPLDFAFDLAEAGFRLEKSKTAEDPGLMMRIGNPSDGTYPGGTIIGAKGYYLIVRDDASNYYLNLADAIATRSEFNWTGSGYIIYLGKGAISSSADPDIIDAVGFGEAKYFQGAAPALAITDNYFLNRIKNTGNNNLDFNLLVSADPSISWEDEGGSNQIASNPNQSTDENNNQNNNQTDNNQTGNNTDNNINESGNQTEEENNENSGPDEGGEENNENNQSNWPADFIPFSLPDPIVSERVAHFWNFSECYGEHVYSVGKYDCSLEISYIYPKFSKILSTPVNGNEFSLSFYYRNSQRLTASPRLVLNLSNNTGQGINLLLEPGLFQAEGLPNSHWRYYGAPTMPDNSWHNFVLVVNKAESYWAVYFDGQEKYKHFFTQTLANNFINLELSSDMGSVAVDELIFWDRSLSLAEVRDHYDTAAPFYPIFIREPQLPAELKYFWNFNEGHEFVNIGGGVSAIDSINGLELSLPPNSWVWRSSENTGIVNSWGKNLEVNLLNPLTRKDLSLSFWWRSKLYPLEGRSLIALAYNQGAKLALAPDQYRRSFIFNDQYGIFSEGNNIDLPYDENWHHFAITYDSYRYQLKLFINGEEKRSQPFYWIKDGQEPNNLIIRSELNSIELDDLGIWEGALTPLQVQTIYQNSR